MVAVRVNEDLALAAQSLQFAAPGAGNDRAGRRGPGRGNRAVMFEDEAAYAAVEIPAHRIEGDIGGGPVGSCGGQQLGAAAAVDRAIETAPDVDATKGCPFVLAVLLLFVVVVGETGEHPCHRFS
jgi:hypothetical protein